MADLYTSQVHLKRLLAGQSTAAFTPAPEAVLKMLDPNFFPGMGALNEDESGRLQCPVRGCGEYFGMLAQHLSAKHRGVGGAQGIRKALEIPGYVGLTSRKTRDAIRPRQIANSSRARSTQRSERQSRTSVRRPSRGVSIMARNFADSCPAQLQAKIAVLSRRIGRSPTHGEFVAEYGSGLMAGVRTVFGSWSNAKAVCGLSVYNPGGKNKIPVALVVESLREWVLVHGDLPSGSEAQRTDRAPMIPSFPVIKAAFGVSTWDAAMRSAVEHLGIKSERYGSSTRSVA